MNRLVHTCFVGGLSDLPTQRQLAPPESPNPSCCRVYGRAVGLLAKGQRSGELAVVEPPLIARRGNNPKRQNPRVILIFAVSHQRLDNFAARSQICTLACSLRAFGHRDRRQFVESASKRGRNSCCFGIFENDLGDGHRSRLPEGAQPTPKARRWAVA